MATRSSSSDGALPVVDLAPFLLAGVGDVDAARARVTEAVREACMSTGFFRVVNHSLPTELMARALELSAAFFALPDEEKAKVRPTEGSLSAPLPAGYARQPARSADKDEYLLVFNPELWLNVYPADPAGFRSSDLSNSNIGRNVGEAPRYRAFKYGDYMQLRMRNKTHPPSRPEDVVDITHYAI